MNKIKTILLVPLLLTMTVLGMTVNAAEMEPNDEESEKDEKGSHNGRLLSAGDFSVELAIFERGVPPEYRAWAYQNGDELSLDDWSVNVELTRLGGVVSNFSFVDAGEYLHGQGVVEEPHSFDVRVTASYQGQSYEWEYESYEGRAEVSRTVAEQAGIVSYEAGPGILNQSLLLYGKTTPDPQQMSHVTARYPGLIKTIGPALGDTVESGQVIATIEANSSLQTYEIKAPITGVVVDKHANPGEMAGSESLMTIANYDSLWVDLSVFPGDMSQITPGLPVVVSMNDLLVESTIRYLNPGEGNSPTVIARVHLPNPDLSWSPGLLVEALVHVNKIPVGLMVDNRAIQTFRDWQVVFIQIGESYEIRPVTLGRTDGEFSEVLDGLNVGDRYVVENSYLLKADIEKDGATHDH